MLTSVTLLLAVLCWPPATGLRAVSARRPVVRPTVLLSPGLVVVAVVSSAVAVGVAGRSPPAAAAAALLFGTVALLIRAFRRRRAELARRRALVDSLELLSRELTAGTALVAALDRAAVEASPAVRGLLDRVALAARFAGSARTEPAGSDPVGSALLTAVAVAGRHGTATVEVLTGFAGTLREELEAVDRQAGATAGAQLSGWLLAALPLLGMAIGVGIGADPVPVLLHTPVGGVLLVAGSALCCAGLLWSARLAR